MYTLYWEHMAGSIVAQAALEMVGAEYRMQYVDMGANAHLSRDFLAINPAARIPALTMPDGETIGETLTILVQLGERHPDTGLTPLPGDADRGAFLFWLSVMATSGYTISSRAGHPERFAESADAIAQVKRQADRDFLAFFDLMESAISGAPYFLERGLTGLDFYVAMLAEWVADRDDLFATRPKLGALCEAVGRTDFYRNALDAHAMAEQMANA